MWPHAQSLWRIQASLGIAAIVAEALAWVLYVLFLRQRDFC